GWDRYGLEEDDRDFHVGRYRAGAYRHGLEEWPADPVSEPVGDEREDQRAKGGPPLDRDDSPRFDEGSFRRCAGGGAGLGSWSGRAQGHEVLHWPDGNLVFVS